MRFISLLIVMLMSVNSVSNALPGDEERLLAAFVADPTNVDNLYQLANHYKSLGSPRGEFISLALQLKPYQPFVIIPNGYSNYTVPAGLAIVQQGLLNAFANRDLFKVWNLPSSSSISFVYIDGIPQHAKLTHTEPVAARRDVVIVLQRCAFVTSLRLEVTNSQILTELAALPGIERISSLDLSISPSAEGIEPALTKLLDVLAPNLKRLQIHNWKNQWQPKSHVNESVIARQDLRHLQALSLFDLTATEVADVFAHKYLPRLKHLQLEYKREGERAEISTIFSNVARQLETLDISGSANFRGDFPKLKQLSINGQSNSTGQMNNLEQLRVRGAEFNYSAVTNFKLPEGLNSLQWHSYGNQFDTQWESFRGLISNAKLPKLLALDVGTMNAGTPVKREEIAAFIDGQDLPSLRDVTYENKKLEIRVIERRSFISCRW